ncbi:hypothetical protein LWI28_022554 [Acer negundo]|uniref:Uncharacterized protein n=1 Tax=Acer negundo TaxID=4023 RepID=A0AAD5NYW5_ACENE|nr:hypothetical protein LWI28_022554 [Acer negundo]
MRRRVGGGDRLQFMVRVGIHLRSPYALLFRLDKETELTTVYLEPQKGRADPTFPMPSGQGAQTSLIVHSSQENRSCGDEVAGSIGLSFCNEKYRVLSLLRPLGYLETRAVFPRSVFDSSGSLL